jgi:MFS family permease
MLDRDSSRAVIAFTGIAHALHHIVTAVFMTVVLALSPAWARPYEQLIALWTFGALLLGGAAPLAGWLGDKLGERRMMLVYLFGIGLATIACGLARGPYEMQVGLTLMGLFGAIYHPVGTAWVVRHAHAKGQAIAIVGAFGSAGVALASVVGAVLTDLISWRAAFLVPGTLLVATGCALAVASMLGRVPDLACDRRPEPAVDRGRLRRTIVVLVIAMCLTSLTWHAFQTMLPKWLGRELGDALGPGLIGIGAVVTGIYLVGALAQFVGGHCADRGYAREAFIGSFALKFAAIALATQATGWPVVVAAVCVSLVFDLAAPIENVLVARYAPQGRRGIVYGVRHGLAIASAPLGVQLVSWLYDEARGFDLVLLAMTALVLIILLAALLLPSETRAATPSPADARP